MGSFVEPFVSLFNAIFCLRTSYREELYKLTGHETFADYCLDEFSLDEKNVLSWIKIADKFFPETYNGKEMHDLDPSEVRDLLKSRNFSEHYGIPVSMDILAELADLPKECTQDFFVNKRITINGISYTTVQIQALGANTVKEIVKIHLQNQRD